MEEYYGNPPCNHLRGIARGHHMLDGGKRQGSADPRLNLPSTTFVVVAGKWVPSVILGDWPLILSIA